MSSLVVTTSTRPDAPQQLRAERIAARCGAPFVERRRGVGRLLGEHDADLAYVVGRHRDQLADGEQTLFVHAGLLAARLGSGSSHPLIRAVTGGSSVRRVVDGTLGLAIDALHLAEATGAEVIAAERAPAIRSLCEEGLQRLSTRWPAARQIRLWGGLAADVLAMLPTGYADAVFMAPMFEKAAAAAPGFDLLRGLAHHAPLDERTRAEALRVAGRLVVKLSPADPVPDWLGDAHLVRSKALCYAVVT